MGSNLKMGKSSYFPEQPGVTADRSFNDNHLGFICLPLCVQVLLRLIASLATAHFSCTRKSSKLSHCYY